jgi:hypothetical protein
MPSPYIEEKGKGRATDSEVLMMEIGERIDGIMEALSTTAIDEYQARVIHYCLSKIEFALNIY